jgi:hypothetical protein
MKRQLFILLTVAIVVGCGSLQQSERIEAAHPPPERFAITDEESHVYAAAVAGWMEVSSATPRIRRTTSASVTRVRERLHNPDYAARFAPAPVEALEDFVARNDRPYLIEGQIPFLDAEDSGDEYPYFTLSRIGFDSHRSFAVVEVAEVRGPLNALAVYLVLQWSDEKWRIVQTIGAWLS